jgi:hypothetical protein
MACPVLLVIIPSLGTILAAGDEPNGKDTKPGAPAAGSLWDCGGGKIPFMDRCYYQCIPADGSFGYSVVKPSMERIRQSCPNVKSGCPVSIQVESSLAGIGGSTYKIVSCSGSIQ